MERQMSVPDSIMEPPKLHPWTAPSHFSFLKKDEQPNLFIPFFFWLSFLIDRKDNAKLEESQKKVYKT